MAQRLIEPNSNEELFEFCEVHVHKLAKSAGIASVISNVISILYELYTDDNYFTVLVLLVDILASTLLIYGQAKQLPNLYLPYIIFNTIAFLLMSIMTCFMIGFWGVCTVSSGSSPCHTKLSHYYWTGAMCLFLSFFKGILAYFAYRGYTYLLYLQNQPLPDLSFDNPRLSTIKDSVIEVEPNLYT